MNLKKSLTIVAILSISMAGFAQEEIKEQEKVQTKEQVKTESQVKEQTQSQTK